MKKRLILIFLVGTFLSMTFCIARDFTSYKEIVKINDEVRSCVDENYMSDHAKTNCVNKGIKRYNAEIKRTLKAAKNYLTKEEYRSLLMVQDRWEKFMKENRKLVIESFKKKHSRHLNFNAQNDIYEYTKNRIEDLYEFLDLLTIFREMGLLDDEANFVPFNN